ncbi:hypothetical protein [Beijerinckia sp. L45]|uniref:hypothetical protein n=1 Tax=Beijerinckia sp. L45 TaxID=1641855 RepID=UPI00131A97C7|nr:hypothetical protein [Beijerinckia sp. L45]
MTLPFRRGLAASATLFALTTAAQAHGIAGDRFFPVTLAIDDPAVSDEASLPTFARSIGPDGSREHDYSFEYDKRITENFGVSVSDTYTQLRPGGSGFQNVELGLKYVAYVNAAHEFMFSVGASAEIGGTGAPAIADGFTSLGPQVYFGKGFGDLPTSLDPLRPFAVTGQIGLAIPTRARSVTTTPDPDGGPADVDIDKHPTVLNWGFSLQYSLPYLNSHVHEVTGPDVLKRLIPLVEVALQSPVAYVPDGAHITTGTVNPGVLYEGDTYQIGVEALLPINTASGKHPGFVVQLHYFLDDIFPTTLGRPIIQ